ncbi:hypothetical protein [Citrifermentans pelophilum]|uniref:hypothetical protein n=1 Tax=Geoanaerobacter pelophilus TaxID=60036 RepID=UPI001FEA1307|nr:hypothetical protein [Geoanaerobacter pelophilus]
MRECVAGEFAGGQEDWRGAALLAATCPGFSFDVEEELVADDARSCYNCRYRRWTRLSFTCMQAGRPMPGSCHDNLAMERS